MKRELIEDDAKAKWIADAYEVSESMLAEASKRLPESIAAKVGICISAKRAAPVDSPAGPFEFVLISYMAGFVEGENGWAVIRWYDVKWEDMPQFAEEILRIEQELLPQALSAESATKKIENYRKENQ